MQKDMSTDIKNLAFGQIFAFSPHLSFKKVNKTAFIFVAGPCKRLIPPLMHGVHSASVTESAGMLNAVIKFLPRENRMAPQQMLRFVTLGREMPHKRSAEERLLDQREIYASYASEKAKEQASRCSQCGVPYCQTHCPLHNNIPDWLKLTAEGRLEEAYQLSQMTNTFPEICGRICPQDRLCEGNCVIEQSGHGTVTIGAVERYITDTAWEKGWVKPIVPGTARGQSVGVIGSGPAGLAAADVLRRNGIDVEVFERSDRAGGLLTYGIPGFKLEKDIVMRRVRQLEEAGVTFRLNCDVGTDVSFEDIRARHDAILIGTGVYLCRELGGPGSGNAGIVQAIDYLTASNRHSFGDEVPEIDDGTLWAGDKNVVVIGGGDTAMDCVRTAVRQGATSVRCLYRRDRTNMPGSRRETSHAEEEGVKFDWLSVPKGFDGKGSVSSVRVAKVVLGAPDATGRQTPEEVPGSETKTRAELVIKALGFEPEALTEQWDLPSLDVTRWGTVRTSFRTHATNLDGVYAAGDIVRGASLVVWAIRDGREAAESIVEYLDAKAMHRAAA